MIEGMGWIGRRNLSETDILAAKASALETCAVRAGAALGCSYANSREYEAALIAERRAAGAYRSRGMSWRAPAAAATALLVLAFVMALAFR